MHKHIVYAIGRKKYHQLLSNGKSDFVKLIERYSEHIPKNEILRWFQISNKKYQQWHSELYYSCKSSSLQLCAKKHPYQITKREYHVISICLFDPIYELWPRSAIHSDLIRKQALKISRSTFYKYAKLIYPERKKWHSRKPPYEPLRAIYVNEYWHMDISYFKTADLQQCFIYAIIDNYSRKIIAWRCVTEINKKIVGEVIRESLELASLKKLQLVSDGGPENSNHYIENLLNQYREQFSVEIDHIIALKTIKQSNSMVERFFRLLKYDFLYHDIPANYAELCQVMAKIIHEYNYVRPHYALQHQTPHEAYCGIKPPEIKTMLKAGKIKRMKVNKNCSCKVCDCH